MSLEYAVTEAQGARIYSIKGRVDSATAGQMEQALKDVFNKPGSRVVVDFSALDYISSAGLRVVLMQAKRAKQTQSRLVLCGLSTQVREVFEISGFLKILDVVPNQAAALA
ncbi:MAG: hypothetical protein RLY71_2165 [Pseudomonadota bacterium]|jgi:anti-anti-sigma factor